MTATTASNTPSHSVPDKRFSLTKGRGVRHEFMAWLPEGMFEVKMAGFVDTLADRVLESTPDRLHIYIGKRHMTPFGRRDVPLEVTITLDHEAPCKGSLTRVVVDIVPRIRWSRHAQIRGVSAVVARAVRYCLMADDFHPVDVPSSEERSVS